MPVRPALLALLAPVLGSSAMAAQAPGTDSTLVFPAPAGWVSDYAAVLSPDGEAALDSLATELRRACLGEVAIVTVPALYGRDARVVARDLGRTWGVGSHGAPEDPHTDTGVVLLLAPNDGQVALELGEGANAFIPDATAGAILDSLVLPSAPSRNWDRGLLRGLRGVAALFAARFECPLRGLPDSAP